jgi:hypothetical protein
LGTPPLVSILAIDEVERKPDCDVAVEPEIVNVDLIALIHRFDIPPIGGISRSLMMLRASAAAAVETFCKFAEGWASVRSCDASRRTGDLT